MLAGRHELQYVFGGTVVSGLCRLSSAAGRQECDRAQALLTLHRACSRLPHTESTPPPGYLPRRGLSMGRFSSNTSSSLPGRLGVCPLSLSCVFMHCGLISSSSFWDKISLFPVFSWCLGAWRESGEWVQEDLGLWGGQQGLCPAETARRGTVDCPGPGRDRPTRPESLSLSC